MSAALKLATIASGFTIFSFSAFHTLRNSHQDFAQSALALEHTFEQPKPAPMIKPKLYARRVRLTQRERFADMTCDIRPSTFASFQTIGGYELKTAA
jgi:cytochrome bd-type quinol oxidase subunit 1